MDSEGTKRAAEMNGSRDEKNKLDLELRLGLPDNDDSQPKNQGQHFDPTLLAANDGVDLSHLAPRPQICLLQEENDNQVSQGRAHFNAGAWPVQSGIQDSYANPIEHHASPSIGIGLPPNQLPTFPGLPPTIVNNLFVDMPQKNSMELGMASSSSGPKKPPAKRGRPRHGDTNNPNRRCTNPLCNAATSPMWRPGPLGPKTLCNACGIKYRKEEEKKKTQLIMQQLHELATTRHNPTE